ncbi:MAG TPA: winged helix DNA-binding domain-containing protein [Ilumatobacteraceae bacterium]|nr:winged helix DNA-binding domain-containing protein [Ilumatobacteraceae bacterium]
MPSATLSVRQINRTVLDRQLLLDRVDLDIPHAMQCVGGLQTQYAPSGYIGLWDRISGFERDALTTALHDRSVVQATLMRTTIHIVAADDFWAICAGIRDSRREWWLRIARSRRLPAIDYDSVARTLRDVLADGPRPRIDLIAALERAGHPKPVWEGAGLWADMVRVPPSGTWERRRADLYGLAEQWIAPVDVTEADGLRLLLTRYLQAFGPAQLADAAKWAGVPRSRIEPIAASMDLIPYVDEAGAALVDLGDAALTDPDVPAPVRLLPTWDATLLAHCRHAAILPEQHRQAIFHTKNPQSVGTVLVDGAVAATWVWRADHIETAELAKLTAKQRREVAGEAERLAAFYRP